MCSSREIVHRAIHFAAPPRLPVLQPTLGVSDVADVEFDEAGAHPDGIDGWGCRWSHSEQQNMGQVTGHPLADIRLLDRHPFPDYRDAARYARVEASLRAAEARGRYVRCGIFAILFERMHMLHGFENTLVDLYEDRPAMAALADHIVDTQLTLVHEITARFPGRIHAYGMTDDWGTQTAAFISYDLWMDFFYPRYRRIFDAMHAAGCDVWLHSCGKVNALIEGYIHAGVDVVNLQQPRALGIAEIGQRYRGRIAFEAVADIQVTLPIGRQALLEADAEELMTLWATPAGGLIFSDYGDDDAIGVHDPTTKQRLYAIFSRWSEQVYGQPLPPLPETA